VCSHTFLVLYYRVSHRSAPRCDSRLAARAIRDPPPAGPAGVLNPGVVQSLAAHATKALGSNIFPTGTAAQRARCFRTLRPHIFIRRTTWWEGVWLAVRQRFERSMLHSSTWSPPSGGGSAQGTSPTHSLSTRRLFSYDSKTFPDSRTNMHSLQSKDMRLPPTALNAATCHLLAMRKRAEACSRTWLIAAAAQRMISLFDCTFCDYAHLCDP
jgi:hypothetical protein